MSICTARGPEPVAFFTSCRNCACAEEARAELAGDDEGGMGAEACVEAPVTDRPTRSGLIRRVLGVGVRPNDNGGRHEGEA